MGRRQHVARAVDRAAEPANAGCLSSQGESGVHVPPGRLHGWVARARRAPCRRRAHATRRPEACPETGKSCLHASSASSPSIGDEEPAVEASAPPTTRAARLAAPGLRLSPLPGSVQRLFVLAPQLFLSTVTLLAKPGTRGKSTCLLIALRSGDLFCPIFLIPLADPDGPTG